MYAWLVFVVETVLDIKLHTYSCCLLNRQSTLLVEYNLLYRDTIRTELGNVLYSPKRKKKNEQPTLETFYT